MEDGSIPGVYLAASRGDTLAGMIARRVATGLNVALLAVALWQAVTGQWLQALVLTAAGLFNVALLRQERLEAAGRFFGFMANAMLIVAGNLSAAWLLGYLVTDPEPGTRTPEQVEAARALARVALPQAIVILLTGIAMFTFLFWQMVVEQRRAARAQRDAADAPAPPRDADASADTDAHPPASSDADRS